VPRHPPHVWKDPDIILKEYDVSHHSGVSSYISIFGPFSGIFSLPDIPAISRQFFVAGPQSGDWQQPCAWSGQG
jgi:hypothetical protein